MKPKVRIATTRTPDGGEMVLYQHDRDFSIMINGQESDKAKDKKLPRFGSKEVKF
ncbi:MAG: hypothetical protein MUO88_09715 [Desulfobacterales bacterium]|nr:hypothetical protein [Desulfobacterales bacterium]